MDSDNTKDLDNDTAGGGQYGSIVKKAESVKRDNLSIQSGDHNQTLQHEVSRVIGAEYIAQSEREGISVKDISMSVWERCNIGKNIVFTEEEVVEKNKRQIIQLHNEIGEHMKISFEKAMEIGELLIEQKKRIRQGGFTYWFEKSNMPFTIRTAQNYMKLFRYEEQLREQNVTSLSNAYALISGDPMPEEVLSATDSTDISNAGWSVVSSIVSLDGFELPKRRPKGFTGKFQIDKELVTRMVNEEYPFEGRKGKYLKMVVKIPNSNKSMDPKLLGDFLYEACDYLKEGGKLIFHKK